MRLFDAGARAAVYHLPRLTRGSRPRIGSSTYSRGSPQTSEHCGGPTLRPSQRSELYTALRFGSSRYLCHAGSVLSQYRGDACARPMAWPVTPVSPLPPMTPMTPVPLTYEGVLGLSVADHRLPGTALRPHRSYRGH